MDAYYNEVKCLKLIGEQFKNKETLSAELIEACELGTDEGTKACLEMLKTTRPYPPIELVRACGKIRFKNWSSEDDPRNHIVCIESLKMANPPSEELIGACDDSSFTFSATRVCFEMLKTTRPSVELVRSCGKMDEYYNEVKCLKLIDEQFKNKETL